MPLTRVFVRVKSILSIYLILFGGDTYKRISASATATLHRIVQFRIGRALVTAQDSFKLPLHSDERQVKEPTLISIKNGFERTQGEVLQWQRSTSFRLGDLEGKHFLYFVTLRFGHL